MDNSPRPRRLHLALVGLLFALVVVLGAVLTAYAQWHRLGIYLWG